MNDICERLRKEIAWEQDVGELLEEAAAEITRLRLTDAERFVLREVMDAYAENDDDIACGQIAAVIFDLLERAK